MSFRARLTLFFVLIVVVPMVALALVLFGLIDDSERGKADARLGAGRDTAVRLFEAARARAAGGLAEVGRDPALATALQRGDVTTASAQATVLLGPLQLKRIVATGAGGVRVDVGSRTAVFPARRALQDVAGSRVGMLEVSVEGPQAYARAVHETTGLDVVVRRGARPLASTLPAMRAVALPVGNGTVRAGGVRLRAATFVAPGWAGEPGTAVTVLGPTSPTSQAVLRARKLVAGILLASFVVALACALLLSAALQRQIAGLLAAAQRLGRGDFGARAPEAGRDEFATLGVEFNRMAAQLEARLEDVRAEQGRAAVAMRRVGETFAANLDRAGLVDLVVRAAAEATGASVARARTTADEAPIALTGQVGELDGLLAEAETEAAASTEGTGEVERDGHAALAQRLAGATGAEAAVAVVAVARADRDFTPSERELFAYLVRQAGVSLENVALHEAVERQAVTDALTGLANRRRFSRALEAELERTRRYGGLATLVLLDIDDFKRVNDTHGHPTGDRVLREVGRALRDVSREIDVAARFGGEEFALLLPGTDRDGAFVAAERARKQIEALRLTLPDGGVLRVTASFGTATQPSAGRDAASLLAAADGALYDAKRTGKNRTVRAGG
jgi:diguanylate cyclase (GGDEF)-like protein